MFKRLVMVALMVVGLVGGAAHAGASGTASVPHVLSLRVVVDGQEVMAPVLQASAGSPVMVAIEDAQGRGHALVVTVLEPADAQRPTEDGMRVMLWRGRAGKGVPLLEGVVSSQGTRELTDGRGTVVELVSHAIGGLSTP